jgi:hypothetical protein
MAEQPHTHVNHLDDLGRPAGGEAHATGIDVVWQNGPLVVDGVATEPNGAFVETLLVIAAERLAFYQQGQFACVENGDALFHIDRAIDALNVRTARRIAAGTEGTHEGA